MTILVTGAGSYVANAVIKQLSSMDFEVTATYRNKRPTDLKGIKLLQLDVCEESGFQKLPRNVDAIVHVAGGTPRHTVNEIVNSAAQGALNLQRYALDSRSGVLMLTSSVSIYGQTNRSIFDETTPIEEPDIYGVSKLLVERIFAATADFLPVISLRLPSVLCRLETESWIPSLMRNLLANKEVTIFNPETAFNNAIDIGELSRFIAVSIDKPLRGFQAFPIASSGSMTVMEVVKMLQSSVGSKSVISVNKRHRRSFTISSEYATRFLGYEPIGISETLHRFVQRVANLDK